MKRITLVLGVVAVMVVMLVALAAPAMAMGNGGHHKKGHHGMALKSKDPKNPRIGSFRVPDGSNVPIVNFGF